MTTTRGCCDYGIDALAGRGASKTQRIDLALQGGGTHGAFTWGVLDRLLADDRIRFGAVSGSSAGAMNAVALAAGWTEGGGSGARETLRRFWSRVADSLHLERGRGLLDCTAMFGSLMVRRSRRHWTSHSRVRASRRQTAARRARETVDFDLVHRCTAMALHRDTNVRNAKLRISRAPRSTSTRFSHRLVRRCSSPSGDRRRGVLGRRLHGESLDRAAATESPNLDPMLLHSRGSRSDAMEQSWTP